MDEKERYPKRITRYKRELEMVTGTKIDTDNRCAPWKKSPTK